MTFWFHAWKNDVRYVYVQYWEDLKIVDPKLLKLLKQYGSVFDGDFEFRLSENGEVVLRAPICKHADKRQNVKVKCPNCNKKLKFPRDFIEC